MDKPLTVVVVGYGYWSPKIIKNLDALPELSLRAIVEKDLTRHTSIRENHPGVAVYQHYSDAFADPETEAVIIATIPSSHYRISKLALELGKHVLVEKPLALSIEDATILYELAERRARTLMVDHTYLYTEALTQLRARIHAGELGKIYSIESLRANLGLFQRDANVVWDLAPHDFSILLWLLEERPTRVSAVGSKSVVHPSQAQAQESSAHIMLSYESGTTAHVYVSWTSPVKIRQIMVTGSERMAVYDQLAKDQLTVFDQGVYPADSDEESGPLFTYKTGDAQPIPLSWEGEDLSRMLADFARAVRTQSLPVSHAGIARDVVSLLSATQRSLMRSGESVAVSYGSGNPLYRLARRARPT